jgi:WD40 repeat protein
VWNSRNCVEKRRIQLELPNVECNCICFTACGKQIVSGWTDGKVRAFGPQSGKRLYVINDAHAGACTAIASMHDLANKMVITGGVDGQVRVWQITKQSQTMVASFSSRRAQVNKICVRENDTECVSASNDGSCIIYNLQAYKIVGSLKASTFFKSILYHPDENQILTAGTDRKVDTLDRSAMRVLDASENELNDVAITYEGDRFITGGADKLLKE